jgi:hypothetical protein
MFSSMKRIGVATLFGLAGLVSAVPEVHGQSPYFQVRPGLTLQQAAFNIATLGRAASFVPPYALGFNPYTSFAPPFLGPYGPGVAPGAGGLPFGAGATLLTNPYGGGGSSPGYDGSSFSSNPYSYYPYSYENPYGSYLRGAADVINAQGRFLVNEQQARVMREQVKADRIANRRRVFDEYLYERERTPTAEQLREEERLIQRDRSRNNPPLTEVYSAKALNDLLVDLQKLQGTAAFTTYRDRTPQFPVEEDTVKRINFSSVKGGGNIGLLKNDGRLSWPVGLMGQEFKVERDRLSSLAQEAVGQVGTNHRVDGGTLQQIATDVDRLQNQLSKQVRELTPAQYIEAKQFLNNFEDAIKALRQPDVGNFFSGKYAAKVKTVGELVDFMTKNGLHFAPATPGDQSAYTAVHRALAAYDFAVQQGTTAEKR